MIRYRTRSEEWFEEIQALTERIPMVERPLMTNADLDPLLDAIGVVYHPQQEAGNYVPTVLTERYDAFLYLDETRALHPDTGPLSVWGVAPRGRSES